MSAPRRTASELVLSRHGQTVWHQENRYAGVSDVDLTDVGQAQAQLLAHWAFRERPEYIAVSPVRRARETAQPVAEVLGMDPVVVEGLREVSFGVAEGHTLSELECDSEGVDMVRRFRGDPVSHPFPGAEAPAAAATRGADALRGVAAAHPGCTVLVVAHNTLLRLALCRLLGIDVATYRSVFPRLDNGTLTRLRITEDGAAGLLSFNVPLQTEPQPPHHPTPSTDGSLRRVP